MIRDFIYIPDHPMVEKRWDRRLMPIFFLGFLLVLLLLGSLLLKVILQNQIYALGDACYELEQKVSQAEEENMRLQLRYASLTSPSHLEKEAQRLGMVPPSREQVVIHEP